MSFAGLDTIYEQRALAVRGTDALSAYTETYFFIVLTPIIVAIGFARLRSCWLTLGMLGFTLSFMITANKTPLLLPLE